MPRRGRPGLRRVTVLVAGVAVPERHRAALVDGDAGLEARGAESMEAGDVITLADVRWALESRACRGHGRERPVVVGE